MEYVEIKLNKCVVYLSKEEINTLLQKDLEIYKRALQRGKNFTRANTLKKRIEAKKEH